MPKRKRASVNSTRNKKMVNKKKNTKKNIIIEETEIPPVNESSVSSILVNPSPRNGISTKRHASTVTCDPSPLRNPGNLSQCVDDSLHEKSQILPLFHSTPLIKRRRNVSSSYFGNITDLEYWFTDNDITSYGTHCITRVVTDTGYVNPLFLSLIERGQIQAALTHIQSSVPEHWRKLVIPYCVRGNHWVLYFVKLVDDSNMLVTFCDPLHGPSLPNEENNVRLVINSLAKRMHLDPMISFIRETTHPVQEDTSSCGAWICYLATQLINDASIQQPVTSKRLRELIHSRLSSSFYDLPLNINNSNQEISSSSLPVKRSARLKAKNNDLIAEQIISHPENFNEFIVPLTISHPPDSIANDIEITKPSDNHADAERECQSHDFSHRTDIPESAHKIVETNLKQQMHDFHKAMQTDIEDNKVCATCQESFPGTLFEYASHIECLRCHRDKKVPKLYSRENNCIPSSPPQELQDLTVVEKMLISAIIPSLRVYKIAGQGQRGYKGHVISFFQNISPICRSLPRTTLPIILFEKKVGEGSRILRVRRSRVAKALQWLVQNNPHYRKFISIDPEALGNLPEDGEFTCVERITESQDVPAGVEQDAKDCKERIATVEEVLTSSAVMNLPMDELEKELRERLLKNVMQWPTVDITNAVNEFQQPGILSMAFPYLFPDGRGDYFSSRHWSIDLGDYAKHLIRLKDSRFREDERLVYVLMNMMLRWRALASGRVYLKQNPSEAAMTATEIREKLSDVTFLKRILAYGASLRGSASYWYSQCGKVEAMCEQLGIPIFFSTLSAADTYWPQLLVLWGCACASELPSKLKDNAVLADWYFTQRFEYFLEYFFKNYFGCTDYYFRVEYQHRGSPHVHGIVWMPNAPDVTKEPVDFSAVCKYADEYLSTYNPRVDAERVAPITTKIHPASIPYDDITNPLADYSNLVNACMRHTRCQQGRCLKTVTLPNGLKKTKCRFNFPKDLQDQTICHYITLSEEGNQRLVLETKRNDSLLCSHSPSQLVGWRANCEMQFITSWEALFRYLLKYLTKGEPISEYLKSIREAACADASPTDTPKKVIQSILMATIGSRDYSAQECSHHLLALPLYFCSRKFETVNTSGIRAIEADGVASNHLDRYSKRHESLEECTLFDFVKKYSTTSRIGAVPHKRRLEAIVVVKPRFKKQDKFKELICQQHLIMHKKWRVVDDLKGSFATWQEAFDNSKITSPLVFDLNGKIPQEQQDPQNEASDAFVEVTDPYHVATSAVTHPADKEQDDWMEVLEDPLKKLLDINGAVNAYVGIPTDPNFDWTAEAQGFDIEGYDTLISIARTNAPFRSHAEVDIASLNTEQRILYDVVYNHMHTEPQSPDFQQLLYLVLGTAGTGKSFVIKALRNLLGDKCVVVAPTGVAASNIEGNTIHNMFAIPVQDFKDLAADSLLELQEKWVRIHYIILDEVSMVGQALLGKIDSRLRQIFPAKSDVVFGGCSILMFGDFGQLPPVMDNSLFSANKPKNALALQGRLAYLQFNRCVFLNTVVRQDGDLPFRDLLLRIRDGNIQMDDWKALCTRDDIASLSIDDSFKHALHLFPTRMAVMQHNIMQLRHCGNIAAIFNAEHPNPNKYSLQAGSEDAGGLECQLALCVNAKVMLTQNILIDSGLVNGSIGFIQGIVYAPNTAPPQLPQVVLVKFPSYTGPVLPGGAVPITPRTFHWKHKNKHHCTRVQIPLTLCWATTVHKSQGLTLDSAFISLGTKEMCAGLSYVALSRVRKLTDLALFPLNFDRLLKIVNSKGLQDRKKEEQRLRALSS